MTGRTTLENGPTLNFVFGLPHQALFQLLSAPVFTPPVHVINSFLRAQETFRVAMTLQTPLHLQWRGLKRDRHLVDLAMTRRTANAFVHMNAVIEISVIRKVVDANPFKRFSGTKTRAHRFEIGTVGPDLLVTIHARVG